MSQRYRITCEKCEAPIEHVCTRRRPYPGEDEKLPEGTEWVHAGLDKPVHENALVAAFIELLSWKPEGGLRDEVVTAMKTSDWYDEGDEDAPFLSQSVIYPLLDWKDNARSFFYRIQECMGAAGFDSDAVKLLARKHRRQEDLNSAVGSGGLVKSSEAESAGWIPETGWTVCFTVEGVGPCEMQVIATKQEPHRNRGDWDRWVYFQGGGRCHFRRLLRIAHYVHDSEGSHIWPPKVESVEKKA